MPMAVPTVTAIATAIATATAMATATATEVCDFSILNHSRLIVWTDC